jgi:hypothetical protein
VNNNNDIKHTIKLMRKLTIKLCKSKHTAIKFLQRAGICDSKGNLSKNYK